jgi:hypothetical protein
MTGNDGASACVLRGESGIPVAVDSSKVIAFLLDSMTRVLFESVAPGVSVRTGAFQIASAIEIFRIYEVRDEQQSRNPQTTRSP